VFSSGFACLVGRPNVGKSTLTNAMVGTKVAITSNRPQTTRRAIRGVLHREDGQIVLVDTPGLHRPRTLLGQRLNDLVRETLAEVDVVVFCLPADQAVGPGDRFLAKELSALRTPVIAAVTKSDLIADRNDFAGHLQKIAALGDWAEVVPVSATGGEQVTLLADLIMARLPEGPELYPQGMLTDEPDEIAVAELVREAMLEGVREELPHSLAVVVEEMTPREDNPEFLDIRVRIVVERDSQKGIIIGKGGARLKQTGTEARRHVAKEWQRDPKQLRKLGF
jgi:GTP-binding protein Era